MAKTDKSVDLLGVMRGKKTSSGLKIVRVTTASPAALVFEGTEQAIDLDVFEMPEQYLPLQRGDRFFTLPIIDQDSGQRLGIVHKLNNPGATGSFTSEDGKTITVTNGIIVSIE